MMTRKTITNGLMVAVVAMGIVGLTAEISQAQVINPTAVVESSGSSTPGWIIDGSGLPGGLGGDILTKEHAANGYGNYWVTASLLPSDTTMTFTLPTDSTVGAVHHWVCGVNSAIMKWGFKTFDISFSTDDGGTFPTTIAAATLGDFTREYISTTIPVQTKTFTQQTGVDQIRLSNIVVFDTSGNRWGMSEMHFGEGTPYTGSSGVLIIVK